MSAGVSKIILGSRGSELARIQTTMVTEALLGVWPELEVSVAIIRTRGDEQSRGSSEPVDPRAGRKGLFTGEIERALAAGEIDVAVHSAKDLPSDMTPGLEVAAVLRRAPVEDVLIRKNPPGETGFPPPRVVATGSVRRQHQVRWKYPGTEIVDVRGNVPTRLRKLISNEWDAMVLARAGIERLGYDLGNGSLVFEGSILHAEVLSPHEFLPAGGQGVIALQARNDDTETRTLLRGVNDPGTLLCLQAEREFLRLLQGDCDSPVGVLATIEGAALRLRAQVFEPERLAPRLGTVEGATDEGGERLAALLMERINGD